MKSTTRTFLTVTEVEPRIVPDATATLLPEIIGTSTTSATTLQYVDDPAHPVTATTLGFTDDPAHPIAVTPLTAALPPNETIASPIPDVPTAILPPTDTAASPTTTPEVLALPPEFLAWIATLSDEEIQSLLALSDAELGALIAGTSAPDNPATPVAGPSLPADITVTLHGVDVGTSPPTPAANPTVVNTVFQIDPNAPPPTATTLEFTNGQQGQGPLVTTLQNPAQAPPIITPQPAINPLRNPPQIVVVGNAPPVVQVAAPVANAAQAGVPTSIRPGNEWLYNTTANGMFVPFMTKTAYAAMITAGNIANGSTSSGWTFGATFGEIGNLISYAPTLMMSGDVPGTIMWQMIQFININDNYNNVRNMGVNRAGSAIIAVGGYIGAPINDGFVHIGNQIHTIYTEQRTGENIAGSVVVTVAYSIVSVVGLVDIHEAVTGREARSGRELTSNERWSRGFLGAGTFLLSLLPFAPSSRAAPAVAAETADAAAARALLEADVRASLQAAQAERRAAAISRGERQSMVPERPAGPQGQGPVPRPEPVPPRVETPAPAERPVPRPEPVPPPVEAPVPPVEAPVPPPVEAPVPPRIETPTPAERPVPRPEPVPPVEAPVPPSAPVRGTYRVLEVDGDVMYIEVQTAEGGTVRILTNTCMEGDTLILRQLHIEEGIAGSIGPRELRATLEAFANEIGNAFGARSVRIEGGIRNSGTINPRTPRVREYEVR